MTRKLLFGALALVGMLAATPDKARADNGQWTVYVYDFDYPSLGYYADAFAYFEDAGSCLNYINVTVREDRQIGAQRMYLMLQTMREPYSDLSHAIYYSSAVHLYLIYYPDYGYYIFKYF